MLARAKHIHVRPIDPLQTRTLVYKALFEAEHGAHSRLSHAVKTCAARVRSIRNGMLGNTQSTDIDDPDMLWAYLVKNLGAPRIGALPRRRDASLVAFLQVTALFVSQQKRPLEEVLICGPTLRVIETALKYFYVVPSADRFRHLDLLETMNTGHRLCYSHQYSAFDTGVLSQVVYLHNPLYKASAPPTSVNDWLKGSNAGPIAAFCQLLPELQVWYEDSQDPLGILGENSHVTKPSDNDTNAVHTSEFTKWVLIVSHARVLLVDRSCAQIYMVPPDHNETSEHHALATLMLYLYMSNQIYTIATVAICGYKLQNIQVPEPEF